MLLVGLKYLSSKIKRLRQIARFYTESLQDIVTCPQENGSFSVYYSYTIITDQRNELKDYLSSKGIETKIQHHILMPYHTAYRNLPPFDIPVARQLVKQILCIPNHEKLTDAETKHIVENIHEFFARS